MKKVIFLAMLFFMPGILTGHPPGDIEISFDPETSMLTVEIRHAVGNPSSHYVKELTLYLEGEAAVVQNFNSQLNREKQKAAYYLLLEEGDEIEVRAVCSISGQMTQKIYIETKENLKEGE